MTDPAVATAADYADAMLTARRAKNWLVGILLFILALQLALFLLVRYEVIALSGVPDEPSSAGVASVSPATMPAGQPADASTQVQRATNAQMLQYVISLTVFAGVVCAIVLALVLLLIVLIMLVGRLIGVADLTLSFVWCLLIIVLLFPWQAFLNNAELTAVEFKVPGVLYNWNELVRYARFDNEPVADAILKWARFVGFPLLAIVLLILIHHLSRRGLRMALGEADAPQTRGLAEGSPRRQSTEEEPPLM